MQKFIFFWVIPTMVVTFGNTAYGSLMRYLGNYKLGVNLIGTSDFVTVSYDVDSNTPGASSCDRNLESNKSTCTETISDPGSGLGADFLRGFGVFLQQPFRKQGFWYFGGDISFGLQMVNNSLPEKRSEFQGRPLKSLDYALYGVRARPYLQIGITPNKLPDVLLSFGPVLQTIAGTVSVNEKEKDTGLAQSSRMELNLNPLGWAYMELEIVFIRFRHGAFSWYTSRAAVNDEQAEGEFYPGSVDGMDNFRASFASHEGGFKLLFNWP